MLRAVIADDDPYMRIILRKALSRISDVEVIAEAENGIKLTQTALSLSPDVVFVDIGMPELDGMESAKRIFNANPDVFIIFATAFDNYAKDAFEVYAFDYLVKPFNVDRIAQTIERIKKVKTERDENLLLKKQVESFNKKDPKIGIRSDNSQCFINIENIVLVTRSGRKTIIYTKNGPIETKETLRNLNQRLAGNHFFRCHKGYIINVNLIDEIIPWGNKTFLVKFTGINDTALMTFEKMREFRASYG